MEFYFSDSNLHKDRFLKKAIDETNDGCKLIRHYENLPMQYTEIFSDVKIVIFVGNF